MEDKYTVKIGHSKLQVKTIEDQVVVEKGYPQPVSRGTPEFRR
jgi:hypothetical protein